MNKNILTRLTSQKVLFKRILSFVIVLCIITFSIAFVNADEETTPIFSFGSGKVTMEVSDSYDLTAKKMAYITDDIMENMECTISDESVVYYSRSTNKLYPLQSGEAKVEFSYKDDDYLYYSKLDLVINHTNLFPQGDLENMRVGSSWEMSNDQIDGWRLYTGSSSFKEGQQFVEIIQENGSNVVHFKNTTSCQSVLFQEFDMPAGQYYVQGDIKGSNLTNNVYIRFNQNCQAVQTESRQGTFDWTTFTSEVTTLTEGKKLKVELYGANFEGEVWFDNIKVYQVRTDTYVSYDLNTKLIGLSTGDVYQINPTVYPDSTINFNYTYKSSDEKVATVDPLGRVKGVKNGLCYITVTDSKYNITKQVRVIVGDEATFTIDDEVTFTTIEEEKYELELDVQNLENELMVFEYTQPSFGKYYIKNNKIVYSPNKDFSSDDYNRNVSDDFQVIVYEKEKGYKIVNIKPYVTNTKDACTFVDYWLTTPKNTKLTDGYIQIKTYDIESLIPDTTKKTLEANGGTLLKQKELMYSSITATLKSETTSKGGNVSLLNESKATSIHDRYYSSTGLIIFGFKFEYTPKAGFTGYDTFEITATNGDKQTTFKVTVYVMPSYEDFKFPTGDSENLFTGTYCITNDEWLKEISDGYKNGDKYIVKWVNYYKDTFNVFTPTGVPANSRTYMEQLAILYRITNDERYFDLCWKQMYEVVKDNTFEGGDGTKRLSWGEDTNGFLDAAMVTYSVAFSYNLIYQKLSEEQKQLVLVALYEEGFYYFETIQNPNVLLHGNNHNLLICGTLAVSALGVMSYDGSINVSKGPDATINVREMASKSFTKAIELLQRGIVHYSSSGGFPEGPSYSYYAHRNMVYLLATLNNIYGKDENGKIYSFGLSDIEGIVNYPNYLLHTLTPNYSLYYYAESIPSIMQPAILWYCRVDSKYNDYASIIKVSDDNEKYNIMNLLWYTPGLFDDLDISNVTELDGLLEDHELATFRSGYGDEYAIFAGLKGVDSPNGTYTHKNLDSGTFELYALGERFIGNYSNEEYNKIVPPGFWDYDYQRWTYYKKNAQGQNTLIFNPEDNPVLTQDPYETAPIEKYESNNNSGYAIVNLSNVYKNDVNYCYRGLMLNEDRTVVTVQDEFDLKKESVVYWSAHTEAKISIINEKLASLTLNGKRIYAHINSELGTFDKMSATALPGTIGLFCNLDNEGVNKLIIKLEGVTEGTLNVTFTTSLNYLETEAQREVTPLNEWKLDEEKTNEKIEVTDVSFDTVFGDQYKYEFKHSQYQYVVRLDKTVRLIPVANVKYDETKYNVTIQNANNFGETTKIVVESKTSKATKTYEFKFVSDAFIEGFEELELIQVSKISGVGNVENLIDNSKSTTWEANGRSDVILEFAEETQITNIVFRFANSMINTYYYDVYTSVDGEEYTPVAYACSSTKSMGDQGINIGAVKAKYVKVVFSGNDKDDLNKLSKINIYNDATVKISNPGETNKNNNTVIFICVGAAILVGALVTTFILIKRRKK